MHHPARVNCGHAVGGSTCRAIDGHGCRMTLSPGLPCGPCWCPTRWRVPALPGYLRWWASTRPCRRWSFTRCSEAHGTSSSALASFISEPVLEGFIVSLALTIIIGQVPKLKHHPLIPNRYVRVAAGGHSGRCRHCCSDRTRRHRWPVTVWGVDCPAGRDLWGCCSTGLRGGDRHRGGPGQARRGVATGLITPR
jgi:hypothetical protein